MRDLNYESKYLDVYYQLGKINLFYPDSLEYLNSVCRDQGFYFEKDDSSIQPIIRRARDIVEITLRGFSIHQLEFLLNESRKLLDPP